AAAEYPPTGIIDAATVVLLVAVAVAHKPLNRDGAIFALELRDGSHKTVIGAARELSSYVVLERARFDREDVTETQGAGGGSRDRRDPSFRDAKIHEAFPEVRRVDPFG